MSAWGDRAACKKAAKRCTALKRTVGPTLKRSLKVFEDPIRAEPEKVNEKAANGDDGNRHRQRNGGPNQSFHKGRCTRRTIGVLMHTAILSETMTEDLSVYRPDFSPAQWTERDLHYLDAFATNPRGIVSVLRNLPSAITVALCSRASRPSGPRLEALL